MFRSLKSVLTSIMFALSLSIVFLNSCSEDEAVKDTTAPVLSFIDFNNGAEVSDTVSISLNATDDNVIEKVDIYIDSVSVSTLTTAPFVFSWNTNTATDGEHTLKAIVTDKSGNTTEKEVSVTVRNILVTINIASNQLKDHERGFVFLSDEKGKLITSKEYKNGEGIITLNGSGFTGTEFFLTEVIISTNPYQWSPELYTFAQIERGKNWVLKSKQVEYVGTATLNYSNAEDNTLYTARTNGGIKYAITSDVSSSNIKLLKSPSKLYMDKLSFLTGKLTDYGLFSGITEGSNSVDLSLVNTPLTKNTITLPEGSSHSFVLLNATSVINDFEEAITIGFFGQTENNMSYDFYYPGSAFAGYHSLFYYETADYFYTHASPKEFYTFDKISNVVRFDYTSARLSYTADGDFDFFIAIFENETSGWYFVCPERADGLIPTIEVPSFLSSYTLPSFGLPTGYTVYDLEKCTDYESLKSFIRQSKLGFQNIFDAGNIYTSMTYPTKSVGGRLSKPSYNSVFSFETRKLLRSENVLNE